MCVCACVCGRVVIVSAHLSVCKHGECVSTCPCLCSSFDKAAQSEVGRGMEVSPFLLPSHSVYLPFLFSSQYFCSALSTGC